MDDLRVVRLLRSPALGVGAIVVVVAIDQVTKALVDSRPTAEAIDLLPILAIYGVHNTGLAFSFFSGLGFAIVALSIIGAATLVRFWVSAEKGAQATAFGLILGGALGNLIDRLRLGYVIDFLLVHVGERILFVFNLADAAMALGLLLLLWRRPGSQQKSGRETLQKG